MTTDPQQLAATIADLARRSAEAVRQAAEFNRRARTAVSGGDRTAWRALAAASEERVIELAAQERVAVAALCGPDAA